MIVHADSICWHPTQDKAKVMEDVRTVISSQLAVDLSKVCVRHGQTERTYCYHISIARSATGPTWSVLARAALDALNDSLIQVQPDANFVDLGADSLDTVSTLRCILSTELLPLGVWLADLTCLVMCLISAWFGAATPNIGHCSTPSVQVDATSV